MAVLIETSVGQEEKSKRWKEGKFRLIRFGCFICSFAELRSFQTLVHFLPLVCLVHTVSKLHQGLPGGEPRSTFSWWPRVWMEISPPAQTGVESSLTHR